jgi:hypothetical protein
MVSFMSRRWPSASHTTSQLAGLPNRPLTRTMRCWGRCCPPSPPAPVAAALPAAGRPGERAPSGACHRLSDSRSEGMLAARVTQAWACCNGVVGWAAGAAAVGAAASVGTASGTGWAARLAPLLLSRRCAAAPQVIQGPIQDGRLGASAGCMARRLPLPARAADARPCAQSPWRPPGSAGRRSRPETSTLASQRCAHAPPWAWRARAGASHSLMFWNRAGAMPQGKDTVMHADQCLVRAEQARGEGTTGET